MIYHLPSSLPVLWVILLLLNDTLKKQLELKEKWTLLSGGLLKEGNRFYTSKSM